MRNPEELCLTRELSGARAVYLVPAGGNTDDILGQHAAYLREQAGEIVAGRLLLIPGPAGVGSALFMYDPDCRDAAQFGALASGLPAGSWFLSGDVSDTALLEDVLLGFCMGAYRYAIGPDIAFSTRLVIPQGADKALHLARAIWLGRDLINMPANLLGPVELAHSAIDALSAQGAEARCVTGDALEAAYPCLAAVGAGSDRAAQVVLARWSGSTAAADAPLLSLVGKGVCFDTGGYDIKPASGMLRMKKDMGGAALMLGLAHVIMALDLPVRLELRLGCVENSISGHAMRPGDVLTTRAGLTVEVGNTDAEGRLVLADLLTEACEAMPEWLVDAATLTGAARVALGPDLPALFVNNESWASLLLDQGQMVGDAMWRLPLWHGYDAWLCRKNAHLGNVSDQPMAGAVTAALFLQHFVKPVINWAHIDTYAWNDSDRPGRPAGGETPALRALVSATLRMINERGGQAAV